MHSYLRRLQHSVANPRLFKQACTLAMPSAFITINQWGGLQVMPLIALMVFADSIHSPCGSVVLLRVDLLTVTHASTRPLGWTLYMLASRRVNIMNATLGTARVQPYLETD